MAEAVKQEVLKMIERMPDDASIEDILYAVYFRTKVEAGLDDIRNGRTVSHEDVMREITEWLQSAGH